MTKPIMHICRIIRVGFPAIMLTMLSACSYHGAIDRDFYRPSATHAKKIPLSVAYDDSHNLRPILGAGEIGDAYSINVTNGLHAAFRNALSAMFERVVSLKDVSEDSDLDFVVVADFDSAMVSRGAWGHTRFEYKLALSFQDRGASEVERFEDAGSVMYSHPPSVQALNVLTGLTLFVLSPVTIPTMIRLAGDHGVDLAEASLQRSVDDIMARIRRKQKKLVQNAIKPPSKPWPRPDEMAPELATPFSGTRWAVIIGISEYEHAGKYGLTNLAFADDDADAFAGMLKRMGWSSSHINLLRNIGATKRDVEMALEGWLSKARPDDMIVIFWSGHGYPDPADPEKVYFACHDTDLSVPVTGYRMDKVCMALEEHNARNVVVMADTCHAGKLITRGEKGISISPRIEKLRRDNAVPKGWVFMVGADSDRKAIENSSWRNGAFTHCLIKGLDGEADGFEGIGAKDGIVSMRELRAYMNTAMPEETQKVLGVAKRPIIATSSGDPKIWDLSLQEK